MSNMIRVIHKRPGLPAEIVEIPDTLEAMQGLLDRSFLAMVRVSRDIHGYVDDEGLLKELPLNFYLRGEPIVGPAIFSKMHGDEDVGFEDEAEALRFCQQLNTGSYDG